MKDETKRQMDCKRYFIADRKEAMTQFKSMTSTLNERGQKVRFETSHCERMFEGYLEPILSVPTRAEATARIEKSGTGDWIVIAMTLTDEGTKGLMGYFKWLEEEWGGILHDSMGSSITVSP